MAQLQTYRELEAWQEAVELALAVYAMTKELPDDERFGLCSQMRRCSVSIPSNIAEGYARDHRPEYRRFVAIARGSLAELETQLVLVGRLAMVDRDRLTPVWEKAQTVGRLMTGLHRSLGGSPRTPHPTPQTP